MPSIFSKIINGEIPCYKVAEDHKHLAFLDIQPLQKGHTLVIPKVDVDYFFDLREDQYLDLMAFTRKVAHSLKLAIPCKKICVSVLGFEVPHAHIHLIPANSETDAFFSNPKLKLTHEEMESIAKKIFFHF